MLCYGKGGVAFLGAIVSVEEGAVICETMRDKQCFDMFGMFNDVLYTVR